MLWHCNKSLKCVYIYINFHCTFISGIGGIMYPKIIYLEKYFTSDRNNCAIRNYRFYLRIKMNFAIL